VNEQAAGALRIEAEDRLCYFAASGADQTTEAEDFAGVEREMDVTKFSGRTPTFDAENFGTERARGVSRVGDEEFAADHLLDDAVGRSGGDGFGGDVAAIAQDGNAIGEAKDFFHAMRNVNDRDAAFF